jgi:hypothetical protein
MYDPAAELPKINYNYTHRGYTYCQKHEKLHNRKNNLSLAAEITKKPELLTPAA